MLFTLDTNCVIDLELNTPFAPPIRALVAAHRAGHASVAIPSISASELQPGGAYLSHFEQFLARLAAVGLDGLPLIEPIAYFGIGFYGCGLLADDAMVEQERQIHLVLHPEVEFGYKDFCAARKIEMDTEHPDRRWRNARCDTQAMWSHIHHGRECFVTRDRNFLKESKVPRLVALGARRIAEPIDAVELIAPAA
jgi:hypothetical protein